MAMSTYRSAHRTRLLALLCLPISHAAAFRVSGKDSVFKVDGDHAIGLEEEHEFELIHHNADFNTGWTVSAEDKQMIHQITTILNEHRGDEPAWEWSEENAGWTFGLVQLTAQTAKGSLALHMLHRHGLAPLLAARAGLSFERFLQSRVRASNMSHLEFFVQTEEEFEDVKNMRILLENMSLSGLRNLHSYDHQWSVDTYAGRVPDCSQRNGGGCILQAGRSQAAYQLLQSHGFAGPERVQAKEKVDMLMMKLGNGESGLTDQLHACYLTPDHTGDIDTTLLAIHKVGFKYKVMGAVVWENGGVTRSVRVDIPEEQKIELDAMAPAERQKQLQKILMGHIERLTHAHKTFMRENRLTVWTNEEVEFSEMFERL